MGRAWRVGGASVTAPQRPPATARITLAMKADVGSSISTDSNRSRRTPIETRPMPAPQSSATPSASGGVAARNVSMRASDARTSGSCNESRPPIIPRTVGASCCQNSLDPCRALTSDASREGTGRAGGLDDAMVAAADANTPTGRTWYQCAAPAPHSRCQKSPVLSNVAPRASRPPAAIAGGASSLDGIASLPTGSSDSGEADAQHSFSRIWIGLREEGGRLA